MIEVSDSDRDRAVAACVDIARHSDRERYLISLFAGGGARDDLLVLLAVNHEIAKTAEMVSEETIGLIRLQWWREAFDGIEAGTPRRHDVVLALADLARRRPSVLDALRRVVDAREADLVSDPFADMAALESYARGTGGAVAMAMAACLDGEDEPASAIGTAWALIGLVRVLPHAVARRWLPVPRSLLEECGLSSGKIIDNIATVDAGRICGPVIDKAAATLDQAAVDRAAIPLRLQAARGRQLIATLRRHGCDPRVPAVQATPPGLAWRHTVRSLMYRFGG